MRSTRCCALAARECASWGSLPRPPSSARSLPTSGGAKAPETPRPVAAASRGPLPRPVPKDLRTAVRRPGTGPLLSSPSASTFEVRGGFGLNTIRSHVYSRRKAVGCGDALGRGGSGVGKVDPPPKQNGRSERSLPLERAAKKETSYRDVQQQGFEYRPSPFPDVHRDQGSREDGAPDAPGKIGFCRF